MKLLIVCPNWVGDVVMATPTLRAVRERYPEARIAGLMRSHIAQTIAGNRWLDDVILYDSRADRLWALIRRLRRERFDLGLLLPNSFRSALLLWLSGVRWRVGYSREGRRFLLNDPLPMPRPHRGYKPSPIIDYYLTLADHLGATTESRRMELFVSSEDQKRTDDLWEKFGFSTEDRVVILNPAAAFGPAKRWPSEYFAELARRLVDEENCKVLIICGPNERGFVRFITDASLRPRQVKSLADEKVSLGLSKALVRRASLMVTTDSGPRHFAAAWEVPVISLFGPTHIEWTNTYYAKETCLQKKLPCGPCQLRVCPLQHHRCMTELTVEMVYAATVEKLNAQPARQAG